MAPQRMMSELDFTKTQLAVFTVLILLAVDSINPVKIFIEVFPNVKPWYIATICFLLIAYVFVSHLKELLYFGVKIFFHSILSIFFREVQIVGRDNIPRHGPVLFSINHANQFIDAVLVLATCEHKLSYLMAYASWKRRIIGDLAWALDVVPVKRAQDTSIKGKGTISMKKLDMEALSKTTGDTGKDAETIPLIQTIGTGTEFTKQLKVGDKIRPPGTAVALKVLHLLSDTEVHLDAREIGEMALPEGEDGVPYDILQRVDQKLVYEKVLDKLASGGTVGIFPEGGSHDRTDLLPLKVGIALIAYSSLEKDGLNIPIVPVGLNYFQRQRVRGRAVVEYGRPIHIDPKTLPDYLIGGQERRKVCNDLLSHIEDAMKSVITTTPDYDTLQLIYTARRLYQRKELVPSEKQDLTRRFAEGYKRLMEIVEGTPPREWTDLQERLLAYQQELEDLGIRDYQVAGLDREEKADERDFLLREMRLPYQIANLIFCFVVAGLPALFLNIPVGLVARIYAERRRKKALAKSKVKIHAHDVMMTEKVLLSIVLVPTLWIVYGVIFYLYSGRNSPATALFMITMPLFAYIGIMVAEAGMVEFKDLKPFLMRLFPSSRRRLAALPSIRKHLQQDLRQFIKDLGPTLGEIYYGKHLDWNAIQEESRLEKERREAKKDM